VQELSLEEASKVLGVPVGTVKSRLFHAKKQLRAELEGEREDHLNGKPALESN
jgi:DNA-directed RNA polymerase specialized sigma24 family protein